MYFSLVGELVGSRTIHSPTVSKDEWESATRWPVGSEFIAQLVDREIFVWGGCQQPSYGYALLPRDAIFAFHIDTESWRKMKAAGDIPRHSRKCASVLLDETVFVFGGSDDFLCTKTNDVFSLNPSSGVFTRLRVDGDRPTPHYGLNLLKSREEALSRLPCRLRIRLDISWDEYETHVL